MLSQNRIYLEERNRVGNAKPGNLGGGLIHCLFFSLLCASVFLPVSASGIDWRSDYNIFLTLERDDNFRLTETDPVETTSTGLFVSGELRASTEVSNFQIGAFADSTNYSESSIEDSETYSVFLLTKRRGERWLGTLDLSFTLAPTTQTELLDTGARIDGERESSSISSEISYQINDRNSIYANLKFLDVSYDTVSLTEYTDNSIALGWVTWVSETSEISINGSASEYDPDNDDLTTIIGLGVGYGYKSSEATRYDLKLGYAEADTPEGSSRDGNSSLEIRHTLDDLNSFTLLVGNGFVGSGAGVVRHESRVNIRWEHALAERMQFIASTEGVTSDVRDYFEILAGWRYRYNREIRLEANYRHRIQQTDTVEADSNSIFFRLLFSPVSGFRHTL